MEYIRGTVTIPMKYFIFNERNCPKLVLNQFTFLKNFWTVRVFLMMVQTVSKTVCSLHSGGGGYRHYKQGDHLIPRREGIAT
jgi:hypothetical protein